MIKLIFINAIVFLAINLIGVVVRLSGGDTGILLSNLVLDIFYLQTDLSAFATHPWGLFTSFFSHQGFFHLLSNMVVFFVFGRLFIQFFSQKRLLYTYILGGIAGGIFEIGAQIFPTMGTSVVLGASGSVMAVMVAIAAHKPFLELNFFNIFKPKLYAVAGILFILDLISLGLKDGTGYFAHIGGAVIGYISVQQLNSSTNIVSMAARFGDWFLSLFRKKPKLSVDKGDTRRMSDEDYNQDKKQRQEQTDRILDKISKSGYESLSKKEKDFLFKQSK
ncbi:MAG: rhomboid family intramembrane serine protease [Crocinitomicaceae bacterium]|nr:rhomboid family intramembrane serine protease [Crocinitomicaceae bacterium]